MLLMVLSSFVLHLCPALWSTTISARPSVPVCVLLNGQSPFTPHHHYHLVCGSFVAAMGMLASLAAVGSTGREKTSVAMIMLLACLPKTPVA
jgi:hypothetical protein